jgi:hypothetical protein
LVTIAAITAIASNAAETIPTVGTLSQAQVRSFPPCLQPQLDKPGRCLISQNHQSLHNRAKTNQYNEQLEKIRKLGVGRELFNRPKADRADDHDNQNPNQK